MPARKSTNGKTSQKNPSSEGLFDAINTGKMVSSAQRIVSSAVNVLEEEIAAGILAAKKIEKKFIDVDQLRNNPDDLMNRIRRDTHEAIDLFLDAFSTISKQLGTLVDSLNNQENANRQKTEAPPTPVTEASVTLIEAEMPLKPGESTILTLTIHDDGTGSLAKVSLQKSDFIGPMKQRIHARAMQIKPATVMVKPGEKKEIALHLTIPKNSLPGKYNALLTDLVNPTIRIVVGIDITT